MIKAGGGKEKKYLTKKAKCLDKIQEECTTSLPLNYQLCFKKINSS